MRSDHLPLSQFLRNASTLLEDTAGDALGLQHHLADFMKTAPELPHSSLDLMILQSLDRMTQTLVDLSTAFSAASRCISEVPLEDWPDISGRLKLQSVSCALAHGEGRASAASHTELF